MNYRSVSDEQLAACLGVARETVTRYRNEQRRLNPEKIAAIAAVLDIEPEKLWQPPPPNDRPSLDALVAKLPTDEVRKLADTLGYLLKTGGK